MVEKKSRTLMQYLGISLRGVAMGASDVVPGVSGGTMAFILGIYEELIDSIRVVGQPEFLRAVFGFKIKRIFEILNWQFLLAVAIGIAVAILSLASLLEYLLVNQPVFLWSFFFGLVLASVIVVSQRIKAWSLVTIVIMLITAVGAYYLVGLVPANTPDTWWFFILSGAIAICAMILPGVSGAFILVLLGKYQDVLGAISDFDILTIAFVGIGAVIGLVSFAQVLGWLFNNYHDLTVSALIGLMIGSLRKVWPWKIETNWLRDAAGEFVLDSEGHRVVTQEMNFLPTLADNGLTEILFAVGLMVIGFVAILILERLGNRPEH